MKTHYLSKSLLIGFTSASLLLPVRASSAPLAIDTFDSYNNATVVGQGTWLNSSGGDTTLALVTQSAAAYSAPNYLKLVGNTGKSAAVMMSLPTPRTLTDTNHNHLQFYFQADNASSGNKTYLYFNLFGTSGVAQTAGRILEGFIDFTNSRIGLTTNTSSGQYNTLQSLASPLEAGSWYLFDAVLEPSASTFELNITNATTGTSFLSGNFSFQNTALSFDRLHGLQFMTNTNGRLDWGVDSIAISSAIPEPATVALMIPVVAGAALCLYRRRG